MPKYRFSVVLAISFCLSFCAMAYMGFRDAVTSKVESDDQLHTIGKYIAVVVPLGGKGRTTVEYRCDGETLASFDAAGGAPLVNESKFPKSEQTNVEASILAGKVGTAVTAVSTASLWRYGKSMLSSESGKSMLRVAVATVVAGGSGYYVGQKFGNAKMDSCMHDGLLAVLRTKTCGPRLWMRRQNL